MAGTFSVERNDILTILQPDTYSADAEGTGVDTINLEGSILVNANIGVATQGTITPVVQHNDVATSGDGGWADVGAAYVLDPDTGEADAFDAVTTAAGTQSNQVRAVRLQVLKRYIRLKLTVADSGVVEAAGQAVGVKKYPS